MVDVWYGTALLSNGVAAADCDYHHRKGKVGVVCSQPGRFWKKLENSINIIPPDLSIFISMLLFVVEDT
jgi:hypothetical protein